MDVIGNRLFVLLTCLFAVMIGFGVTLPVLPFYVERLAHAEGATRQAIALHRHAVDRVYPLGQACLRPRVGTLVRSSGACADHGRMNCGYHQNCPDASGVLPKRSLCCQV